MFTTLLESRAERQRRPVAQAVSLATHAALIAGAVLATHRITTAAPPEPVQYIRYVAPVAAPRAPTSAMPRVVTDWHLPAAPIVIPDVLPPIDLAPPAVSFPSVDAARPGVSPVASMPDSSGAFPAFGVETPARLVPGTAAPVYPELLRAARVEGDVRTTFVIDVNGRADMRTFRILWSSHPRFSEAVTRAVPAARFVPAEIGGKPVRQWVLMPFVFSIR